MTTDLPQLHPTRDFLIPPPARLSRAWLAVAALGLAAGTGYATWTLLASAPEPPPPSSPALAALAAAPLEQTAETEGADTDEDGFETEAEAEAPKAAEGEPEAPNSFALPSTNGAYFVQVASYKDPADAKNQIEALVGRGLPAEGYTETSWSKIRLGPFPTRAEAEKARFRLDVNQRRDAYVMPRSNGKFHVQVGSFASMADAEPLAKRLEARGHVTKVSRIKMGDNRWHCVRIGPFDTYEEATSYLDLVDVHGSKPRVIPFEPIED